MTTIPLRDAERTLIGVLLAEPRAIIPVAALLNATDFTDSLCSRVFATIVLLAHNQKVPNTLTVAAAARDVSVTALEELVELVNPKWVQESPALAQLIAQEATYRRVSQVTQTLASRAAARPADLSAFVYDAYRELGAAVEGRGDRPSDLATIGVEADQRLADEAHIVGIATGFDWLTARIGGIRPARILALVAPFKGRKSTIARVMVLAAARDHRQTDVYLLEGDRTSFYLALQAMLATEFLYRELDERTFAVEAILEADKLHQKLRTVWQQRALQSARDELNALRPYLRLVDGKDGIGQLHRFTARLRRDHFLYGTEFFVLDHLQLLHQGSAKLFESVEASVGAVQEFVANTGASALILSQKNQAAIGENDDDDASYSVGTKGGGALEAAADYVLTTFYDGKHNPDYLKLRLKHSRWAQPGECNYQINPSSGWPLKELPYQAAPYQRQIKGDWRRVVEDAEDA